MSRGYSTLRGAYYPRSAPMLAVGFLVSGGVGAALGSVFGPVLQLAVGIPLGVLVGWGIVEVRWWAWRRRHPERPLHVLRDEFARRRREAAPFN